MRITKSKEEVTTITCKNTMEMKLVWAALNSTYGIDGKRSYEGKIVRVVMDSEKKHETGGEINPRNKSKSHRDTTD